MIRAYFLFTGTDGHSHVRKGMISDESGVLEFTTKTGETFMITPGDILVATDHVGTGHRWRLMNDEPWKRIYLIFKTGEELHFFEAPK